jgi:hypothetical protein
LQVDFQFDSVSRGFYGTLDAPRATDHDALLETLARMTVDAEQDF